MLVTNRNGATLTVGKQQKNIHSFASDCFGHRLPAGGDFQEAQIAEEGNESNLI